MTKKVKEVKEVVVEDPQADFKTPANIKLTREELESIHEIHTKSQKVTYDLGLVEIQKNEVEKRKQALLNEYAAIGEMDMSLADGLFQKYGKGSVDFKTGEYIPAQD